MATDPVERSHARMRAAAVARLPARLDLRRLLPSSRSLLVAAALAAAGVGCYLVARSTPMFELRRVEVVGSRPDVAGRVEAALAPLVGKSLLALRAQDLERRVATLPDVVSVSHDRAFPHTLRVFVVPERPLFVLRQGIRSWLVSDRARVVAELPKGTHPGLARLWVPPSVEVAVGDTLADVDARRATRVLTLARAELGDSVRAVRIGAGETTLILRSGLEIRLGAAADVHLKLGVAAAVLPELTGSLGYLDVAVPSRPVAGDDRKPQVEVESSSP